LHIPPWQKIWHHTDILKNTCIDVTVYQRSFASLTTSSHTLALSVSCVDRFDLQLPNSFWQWYPLHHLFLQNVNCKFYVLSSFDGFPSETPSWSWWGLSGIQWDNTFTYTQEKGRSPDVCGNDLASNNYPSLLNRKKTECLTAMMNLGKGIS